MLKKHLGLILVLTVSGVLFYIGGNIMAHICGDPFSTDTDVSEGAWYDETWLAHSYYNLEQVGASSNYRYQLRDNTNIFTASSTNKPDVVITEWWVRGHVHFPGL
jgi:hypothetical protein